MAMGFGVRCVLAPWSVEREFFDAEEIVKIILLKGVIESLLTTTFNNNNTIANINTRMHEPYHPFEQHLREPSSAPMHSWNHG